MIGIVLLISTIVMLVSAGVIESHRRADRARRGRALSAFDRACDDLRERYPDQYGGDE